DLIHRQIICVLLGTIGANSLDGGDDSRELSQMSMSFPGGPVSEPARKQNQQSSSPLWRAEDSVALPAIGHRWVGRAVLSAPLRLSDRAPARSVLSGSHEFCSDPQMGGVVDVLFLGRNRS